MKRAVLLLSLVLISLVAIKAEGQCCSVPNGSPYLDEHIILEMGSIVNETVHFNTTVFIENDLVISNSTVVMDGKGFILNGSASLFVNNSSIIVGDLGNGFYLDLLGDAVFHEVLIDGCLDIENGYFGIYIEGSNLAASGLEMRRSGMLRLDGGNLEMEGSIINGLVSFSGNVSLRSCTVDQTGITQLGEGDLSLRDVIIQTNISFTQTAAFSALEGADIDLENIEITGTFNGGLSVSDSRGSFQNISVTLSDGVFGLRISDTQITEMYGIYVDGVSYGMELDNSTIGGSISGSMVRSQEFGIALRGNNIISIKDSEVQGARYGIVTGSPLKMENVTMKENQVGLLSEDSSILQLEDCTFSGYTQWGIEDETWEPVSYPDNEFIPGETGLGQIAWWGWVDIEVTTPDGLSVMGADVTLEQTSGQGSRYEVKGDSIGLVWGFTDGSGIESEMRYDAAARWGNARSELHDFLPSKDRTLSIQLNMTDIWVKSVVVEDGTVHVVVACEGSDAKDVEVQLLIDDFEFDSQRLEIDAEEEMTIDFPLNDVQSGDHRITVVVSSNDEYRLMNGYLQENNILEITEFVRPERDDGELGLILVGIAAVVISLLLLLIFIRKQD
ncbi:MAG: NosD domain-containing protein [Thermoplasmatota archaeon]